MKAAIHYAFDSFLRKFHEGYRLFLCVTPIELEVGA